VTAPLFERAVWTEIDREARKGKPVPSDHAPLVIDVDERGYPFDAGWSSAEGRIAARRVRPARGLKGTRGIRVGPSEPLDS
jgi:exodeoxyribonuclease-3